MKVATLSWPCRMFLAPGVTSRGGGGV
ncbi:hypothetical protein AGR9A_Cc70100 [Agrobacterium salinitolerans str. Hayward 0363]|nr:hypothetical protein AGR9A_Cc70100 [Agrobacterium salinitolerans str. Hayward 0363]